MSSGPPENRLDSWKEIAAYLGRGVTTVQRWEKEEGLPVHRLLHQSLSSVFAYTHELDAWRECRKLSKPAATTTAAPVPEVIELIPDVGSSAKSAALNRRLWIGGSIVTAAAVG